MKYPEWLSPFVFSPSIPFRWYGTMYMLGFLVGFFMFRRFILDKKMRLPIEEEGGLFDMMVYIVLGVVVGGRIGNFLLYSPSTFINAPWEVIGIHYDKAGNYSHFALAGMSFHAGLIGTILGIWVFCKRYGYRFYPRADWIVVPAPLGLFFGRMGNFFNAELYGTRTDSIFGMRFPLYYKAGGYEKWIALAEHARPYTQPRHPSQLYEALLEGLLLFVILRWASKKRFAHGTVFWMFIAGYGLFRFSVEFVREPSIAWSYGWLTSGMIYSLPMFVFGMGMIVYLNRKYGPRDDNYVDPRDLKKAKAANKTKNKPKKNKPKKKKNKKRK